MQKKFLALQSFICLSTLCFSGPLYASILPKNDLHLQDIQTNLANMSEPEFKAIIESVSAPYKVLAKQFGATLQTNMLWRESTVNAQAWQQGNTWNIDMYGGLARRPEVTPDGFALVVCHELGHHFAGFPFIGDAAWAASEGQSDYFATQVCAKKIWGNKFSENAYYRNLVPKTPKRNCDIQYSDVNAQNLCYRTALAGSSLANLLAALNKNIVPSFDKKDPRKVTTTIVSHPPAQCRLDTYVAGSLCSVGFNDAVIPGRRSSGGQFSEVAEKEAEKTSCMASNGYASGVRPSCWFAPKLKFLPVQVSDFQLSDSLESNNGKSNGNGFAEPGEQIELKATLENSSSAVAENVTIEADSLTQGILVEKNEKQLPDLHPGKSETHTKNFTATLNKQVQCGEPATIQFRMSSNQGVAVEEHSFIVGQIAKFFERVLKNNLVIPDNSQKGLVEALQVEKNVSVKFATVSLNIPHTFPSDLRVALYTPKGTEFIVFPTVAELAVPKNQNTTQNYGALKVAKKSAAKNNERVGLFQSFQIAMPKETSLVENSQGAWKLKVSDVAKEDKGQLESWSLSLNEALCSTAFTNR